MKPEASSLSLFKFKNFDIRTLKIDGEPWFVAQDVRMSAKPSASPNRERCLATSTRQRRDWL